jgi:hypothetical protein
MLPHQTLEVEEKGPTELVVQELALAVVQATHNPTVEQLFQQLRAELQRANKKEINWL